MKYLLALLGCLILGVCIGMILMVVLHGPRRDKPQMIGQDEIARMKHGGPW